MYQLQSDNTVKNLSTGMKIPLVDGNMDYEEYKQWLLDGGVPMPEFTALELAQNAINLKWYIVNTFKSTLTITALSGNKFAANDKALLAIGFKVLNTSASTSIPWIEDWGNFVTSTVELQEVLNTADLAIQNFINTTFGV